MKIPNEKMQKKIMNEVEDECALLTECVDLMKESSAACFFSRIQIFTFYTMFKSLSVISAM